MTAPLPPLPPPSLGDGPVLRHTTLVLLDDDVQLATVVGFSGRGSVRIGRETSALDVICSNIDAARHLHEATGQLLSQLEQQARDRLPRDVQIDAPPLLQVVRRG